MKCLVCDNQNILESIENKKYVFKMFPFSSGLKCSCCDTKYDILFLLATPHKINYVITKRSPLVYSN